MEACTALTRIWIAPQPQADKIISNILSYRIFNNGINVTPFGIYPYHQLLSQSRLRDLQLFDHYNDAQKEPLAVFR
jgi:hypothetical protein